MDAMGATPTPCLLMVSHPGHEIRCHGWMERNKPLVLVLTSGGGACRTGRTASTQRVVEEAGAACGPLMGSFSDADVYEFMASGNPKPLADWTEEAASVIARHKPETLLTDMVEGFNPSHDLLAFLAYLAVEKAAALGWRTPRLLCQPLEGRPDLAWGGRLSASVTLELGDEELARKLGAARNYPELAYEVDRAIAEHSEEAFRRECLYEPARGDDLLTRLPDPSPFYEIHGERQVAAGKYSMVIRRDRHVVPLAQAVRRSLGLA